MSQDPAGLHLILAEVTAAVRRAYSEGYRQGAAETIDKMTRAAVSNIDSRIPALMRQSHVSNPGTVSVVRSSAPVPKTRNGQNVVYGSVIGAFREAILAAPEAGVSKDELMSYCRRLGLDITINQYRETIKRLSGGQEVERHHGVYYPGPKLRGDLAQSPPNGFKDYPSRIEADIFDVNSGQAEGRSTERS